MSLSSDFKKGLGRLLSDEKRTRQIARALGVAQRGKRALEKGQDDLLRAFRLAPKSDYQAIGKRLAGLKRRARELERRLKKLVE